MDFIAILNQIGILFVLISAGYLAKRRKVLNQTLDKGLSVLAMQIALPALIIRSMQNDFSKEMLVTSIKIIGLSVVIYGLVYLITLIVLRVMKLEPGEASIIQFSLMFSNGGYMGYPVIHAIYGKIGVFYTSLFNIPFNLLMWTLGVSIMSRSSKLMKKERTTLLQLILNPGFLSVLVGFAMFVFSIRLPYVLDQAFLLLGDMTTPLSMLVIGSMLADIPFWEIFSEKNLILSSFIRLLLIPFIFWLLLSRAGIDGMLLGIAVVILAMPAAATTAVFGALYEVEPVMASKSVFVSTVLSIFTIPIICLLLV